MVIEFLVLEWTEYWFVILYQQFSQGLILLAIVYLFRPGKQRMYFMHVSAEEEEEALDAPAQTEAPLQLRRRHSSENSPDMTEETVASSAEDRNESEVSPSEDSTNISTTNNPAEV